MRVLPVALATFGRDEVEILEAVCAQAHVTHHNPVSDAACGFIAQAVQRICAAIREVRCIAPASCPT